MCADFRTKYLATIDLIMNERMMTMARDDSREASRLAVDLAQDPSSIFKVLLGSGARRKKEDCGLANIQIILRPIMSGTTSLSFYHCCVIKIKIVKHSSTKRAHQLVRLVDTFSCSSHSQ